MADRSFPGRLSRESETWVAEGIVTAEQAAAIRARYGDPAEERRGSATTALAVIGGLTLGVGVIGFVAANWDGMSHGARLALLTLAVGGSYAAGFHFRDRTRSRPRVGEALYLLGVLLFGASLFLVGQMYNVQAHDPLACCSGRWERSRPHSSSAHAPSPSRQCSSSRPGSGSSSASHSTTRAAIRSRRS